MQILNSLSFHSVKCLICINYCNFHVYKWENAYKNIFMLEELKFFLCIYIGEGGRGLH